MDYDKPLPCSVGDLRACTTIEQRLALAPDDRLQRVVVNTGALCKPKGPADDMDGSEEDAHAAARALHFTKNNWEWEDENAPDHDPAVTDSWIDEPRPSDTGLAKEDYVLGTKGVMGDDAGDDIGVSPPVNAGEDQHGSLTEGNSKGGGDVKPLVKPVLQGADLGKWSKIRKLYTLQEAWTNGKVRRNEMKYVGLRRKKYKFVYPSLACTTCCHLGSNFVPVGDAEYLNDCRTTKRWFDFDFISGFSALVSHEAPLKNYSQSHSPVSISCTLSLPTGSSK